MVQAVLLAFQPSLKPISVFSQVMQQAGQAGFFWPSLGMGMGQARHGLQVVGKQMALPGWIFAVREVVHSAFLTYRFLKI
jgi:hypothetical protein